MANKGPRRSRLALRLFVLCILLKFSCWLFLEPYPPSPISLAVPPAPFLSRPWQCNVCLSRPFSCVVHGGFDHCCSHRRRSRFHWRSSPPSASALLVCLLLVISGDVETNPGPGDTVLCICGADKDGDMVQCEICSRWSHCSCVNIPLTLAETYPFVCPHCIKSSAVSSFSLTTQISCLENRFKTLALSLQSTSPSLPSSVQTELDSMREAITSLALSVSSLMPAPLAPPPTNQAMRLSVKPHEWDLTVKYV